MHKIALFLVFAIVFCSIEGHEESLQTKPNPRGIKRAIFAKTINFDNVDLKTAPRGKKRFSDKNDFEVIYDASANAKKSAKDDYTTPSPYIPPKITGYNYEPPTYLPPQDTPSTPGKFYLPIIETTTRRITTPGRTITYGTLPTGTIKYYSTTSTTYRPYNTTMFITPTPLPPIITTKKPGYVYRTPGAAEKFDREDNAYNRIRVV